jgi:hypothetical protein
MITITEYTIHRKGENAVFGDGRLKVSLDDEAVGYFAKVSDGSQEISVDFDEIDELYECLKRLKETSQNLEE